MADAPLARPHARASDPAFAHADTRRARTERSVRYHDLMPVLGIPGIGVAWDDDGLRHGAVVVDRQWRGRVAFEARIPHGPRRADDADVLRMAAGPGTQLKVGYNWRARYDLDALLRILPGPGDAAIAGVGLRDSDPWEMAQAARSLSRQRGLARRAVLSADLPAAMRTALLQCLDGWLGIEAAIGLLSLRENAGHPCWDAATTVARIPGIVLLLRSHEALRSLDATNLRDAIRKRWPTATEAHLRRLSGPADQPSHPGRLAASSAAQVLGVAFDLPPDWLPRGEAWERFTPMAVMAFRLGVMGLRRPAELLLASHGDWETYGARVAALVGASDRDAGPRDAHERVVSDCGDPARALADDVVIPLLARRAAASVGEHVLSLPPHSRVMSHALPHLVEGGRIATRILYEGKSLASVLEASSAWHARAEAIRTAVHVDALAARAAGPWDGWPPLLHAPLAIGDVLVVPIHDERSLHEEGASGPDRNGAYGLSHCIASRASRLAEGDGHALSLRLARPDGTWSRLSTAQVSVRTCDGSARLSVVEHRGRGNSAPPREAAEAIEALAGMVSRGEVELVPGALANSGDGDDHVARACGYDWRSDDAVANAVRAWSAFLPRWARDVPPDGLLDALIGRGVVATDVMETLGWD